MTSIAVHWRRAKRAVSPVVSTVLLVAITVVLAAVLFVIVSSMLTPPPPPPVALVFTNQGWDNGTNTATIQAVTGAASISVASLDYIIRDAQGMLIFTGKADTPVAADTITVTVHYDDLDAGDRVTPGDRVQIIVDPISGSSIVDGGVIEMYDGSKQIASHGIS